MHSAALPANIIEGDARVLLYPTEATTHANARCGNRERFRWHGCFLGERDGFGASAAPLPLAVSVAARFQHGTEPCTDARKNPASVGRRLPAIPPGQVGSILSPLPGRKTPSRSAREELGIDPNELGGSAWIAAASSFTVFVVGAIVPVTPFFFIGGSTAIAISTVASGVALFALGAATTVFTGRNALFAAARTRLRRATSEAA